MNLLVLILFCLRLNEKIILLQVEDLVDIADHAYSHKQILVMEKTILSTLEWYLTVPTHYVFLARFIKASIADEKVRERFFSFFHGYTFHHIEHSVVFWFADGEYGALFG